MFRFKTIQHWNCMSLSAWLICQKYYLFIFCYCLTFVIVWLLLLFDFCYCSYFVIVCLLLLFAFCLFAFCYCLPFVIVCLLLLFIFCYCLPFVIVYLLLLFTFCYCLPDRISILGSTASSRRDPMFFRPSNLRTRQPREAWSRKRKKIRSFLIEL